MTASKNQLIIHKLKNWQSIRKNQKSVDQYIFIVVSVLGLGDTKAKESEDLSSMNSWCGR